jgi:hypothetical protein
MNLRNDILVLRAGYCRYLASSPDRTDCQKQLRIMVAGFIGDLDGLLVKIPKGEDEDGNKR